MSNLFDEFEVDGLGNVKVVTNDLVPEDTIFLHNTANSSSSNNIIWTTQPNTAQPNVTPSPYGNWSVGSNTTWTVGGKEATYTILKLPRKKMPEKIFVQGLLKTCGLLGTDAECAYTGKDMIVFSPHTIPLDVGGYITFGAPPAKSTISIEYHDAIYHYVVDYVPVKGDNTTILDVRQVGEVKKER